MGHSERFAPIFHWTLSLLSPTSPWTVGWALGFGSAPCCASRGHKSPAICRNNSHYITKRCANRKGEQTKGISVLSLHPKPLPMYATRFLLPPHPFSTMLPVNNMSHTKLNKQAVFPLSPYQLQRSSSLVFNCRLCQLLKFFWQNLLHLSVYF